MGCGGMGRGGKCKAKWTGRGGAQGRKGRHDHETPNTPEWLKNHRKMLTYQYRKAKAAVEEAKEALRTCLNRNLYCSLPEECELDQLRLSLEQAKKNLDYQHERQYMLNERHMVVYKAQEGRERETVHLTAECQQHNKDFLLQESRTMAFMMK